MNDQNQTTIIVKDERGGPGTAAGIIGILGFVLGWIPVLGLFVGLLLGGVAVLLSLFSFGKRGQGMGIVGLILGLVTILFKLIPGFNLL